MASPNEIGARSESMVLATLLRAGYQVLLPYGVARYDLVIDDAGAFKRVQVKTGRIRNGTVVYNVASTPPGCGGQRRYYTADEVDLFGVYCPQTDEVYLVPIGDAKGVLRLDPPRNGQRTNIRMAADYKVA